MLNCQNLPNLFLDPSDTYNPIFSLSDSFENLKISKPLSLGQKKDEYLRSIRSQKRKNKIHSKRIGAFSFESLSNELDNIEMQEETFGEGLDIVTYINECLKSTYSFYEFNEIIRSLYSNNRFKQHFGVIGLRKLLSIEHNPPIQKVIEAGVIPRFIEFMQRDDEPHLQTEATWAMTNIASGSTEQTKQVVDQGTIPVLVKLLESPRFEIKDQAIWALGNISGDNAEYRDLVLQAGALDSYIRMIGEAMNEGNGNIMKNGAWALCNLCRGKPLPEFSVIKDAIPVIAMLIMSQQDIEILTDTLWALSYISEGDQHAERIQMILGTGVMFSLVKILDYAFGNLVVPCVKTIGNIFAGPTEQAHIALEIPEMMTKLLSLLSHNKENIRKEIILALSNLFTSTPENLEFMNAYFLGQIIELSTKDTSSDVRKEAVLVLSNTIKSGNQRLLKVLLDHGIIEHMGKIIQGEGDQRIQAIVLKVIGDLLGLGLSNIPEGYSPDVCRLLLEQNNTMQVIKELRKNENPQIAELAYKIIGGGVQNYFNNGN